MRSFSFAALAAALASMAHAQNACGQNSQVMCQNMQPPLQSGQFSICLQSVSAASTVPAANQLPQSQASGVTNAQNCAILCGGVPACKYSVFVAATVGGSGSCTLSSKTLLATDLTFTAPASGESDFIFILPPCAVSSSSIAPVASSVAASVASSAIVAASSAAVVASSVPVVASSVAASVASSAAVVASSVVASVVPSASASAVPASFPICPQNNLATFTAATSAGNSVFSITCGSGTVGRRELPAPIAKRQIAGAPLNAFGICITACANVLTCQSVLFNPINGACVLFDCQITVPAGLSGAIRITAPGGTPFVGKVCPSNTPTTVPAAQVPGSNGTVFNLNFNLNVNVNVNVQAGKYKGVPYTQICTKGKCDTCDVCSKEPVNECCACEAKGKPSPLKPSSSYCTPAIPGEKNFPAYCEECAKAKTAAPPSPAGTTYPSKPAKGGDYPSGTDYPASNPTGKYSGPYSNDAGRNGISAIFGGAAVLALALA